MLKYDVLFHVWKEALESKEIEKRNNELEVEKPRNQNTLRSS